MDIPRNPPNRTVRRLLTGAGVGGFIALTAVLAFLDPPAPAVSRSAIWIDTVRTGEMVREVRGTGTLVPVRSILIASEVGGQVQRILVENGTSVTAGDPLIELSNPILSRDAAEAARELSSLADRALLAESRYADDRLTLEMTLEEARDLYLDEIRTTELDRERLSATMLSPERAALLTRGRAENAGQIFSVAQRRFDLQLQSLDAQRRTDETNLERERASLLHRIEQADRLLVQAQLDGIVQEIDLDIGESVGAFQTLGRIVEPDRLKAVLRIPETQVREVLVGQSVEVDTRLGIVPGRVGRIDPTVQNGTVAVDVLFDEPLPQGVRPDLGVEGTVEIERIGEALQVGRPTAAASGRTISLFRLTPDGSEAERTEAAVGRTSIGTIEILRGLSDGDVIILSDMSEWGEHDRVRLR